VGWAPLMRRSHWSSAAENAERGQAVSGAPS
jgi:hypothetical protein